MKRVATALALIAISIYLIFVAPQAIFLGAAVVVGLICYFEYAVLVEAHGIRKPGVFGVLAGIIALVFPQYALIGLSVTGILALSSGLRFAELKDVLPQTAAAILGALYTFVPWRFAADLRNASVHWLFFALALNWAGDSTAYYVGRAFGKHRLAPIVSPNKSWEGAIGSVGGSVVFGIVYMHYFVPTSPAWMVGVVAAVANVAGQLGDLAESAIKRGAGVKDSGSILPGHGGLLDRLDSSLFALPVVYALTRFVVK